MNIQLAHSYGEIISMENLLAAWQEFIVGKSKRTDVLIFARSLMDNIVALHEELSTRTYRHGGYEDFRIADPKPRHIHKGSVRDRLVHHAIYRVLYSFFDRTFITDSFSCRNNKGVHAALYRFANMALKVSRNNTRTCWVLKCDIQKFFASVNHNVLLRLLDCSIADTDIRWLLREVVWSFGTHHILSSSGLTRGSTIVSGSPIPVGDDTEEILKQVQDDDCVGLPLGNLTSQLFANIYLNELDQFTKHRLKAQFYIRYADDFVFLSHDRALLESLISIIRDFLDERLRLILHPKKLFLKTLASGVDFLGWVHFQDYRVLRTSTKHRMLRRVAEHPTEGTLDSYHGLLSYGNANGLQQEIAGQQWLLSE